MSRHSYSASLFLVATLMGPAFGSGQAAPCVEGAPDSVEFRLAALDAGTTRYEVLRLVGNGRSNADAWIEWAEWDSNGWLLNYIPPRPHPGLLPRLLAIELPNPPAPASPDTLDARIPLPLTRVEQVRGERRIVATDKVPAALRHELDALRLSATRPPEAGRDAWLWTMPVSGVGRIDLDLTGPCPAGPSIQAVAAALRSARLLTPIEAPVRSALLGGESIYRGAFGARTNQGFFQYGVVAIRRTDLKQGRKEP